MALPRRSRGLLRLLAVLALALAAVAQFPKKEKVKAPAVKSDIKYIRCGVCQELAKNLARELKELRDAKGAKLKESDVLEKIEPVCDPDTSGGAWLAKLDLVESGKKLKVVEQPRPGKCGTECRTAARACVEALADHDTDLAEAIFAQRGDPAASGRAALEQLLCRDLGDACAQPPPPLPASRPPGPAFEAMSEQEAEMEKLMRSMSGIPGMPGMSMYSRDDLASMSGMGGMGGDGDEDEDEDDGDSPSAPPRLGGSATRGAAAAPPSGGAGAMLRAAGAELAERAAESAELVASGARAALSWARKAVGGGGGEL